MITESSLPIEQLPMPPADIEPIVAVTEVEEQASFIRRHAVKFLAAGAIAGGAVLAYPHVGETVEDLKANAHWTIPAVIGTEAMWDGGAIIMIGAAGKSVGNPLKLRSRLAEVKDDVIDNRAFRVGRALNMMGEIGTASVITVGTVTTLPMETWPVTFAALGTAAIPSVTLWNKTRKEAPAQKVEA